MTDGEKGLSALGFSLFKTGEPCCGVAEVWATADKRNRIAVTNRGADFYRATDNDIYPRFASPDEMQAAIKRIEELESGDAK